MRWCKTGIHASFSKPLKILVMPNSKQIAAVATALSLAVASHGLVAPVRADQMSATVGRLGKICKMRVVDQFDVPMSDAGIRLGETLQQSIDAGEITMKDVKRSGLSFNWEIRGKSINGYCNINYNGSITEFKQGI